MRVIVLFMQRQAVAQGIIHKLQGAGDVRLIHESSCAKADELLLIHNADAALIEIPQAGTYDARRCLALCARLRRIRPGCRLLILCPEEDETSVAATVNAKQTGGIDDFLFYDASIDYLASKLLSK